MSTVLGRDASAQVRGPGVWWLSGLGFTLYLGVFVYALRAPAYDAPGGVALAPLLVLAAGLGARRLAQAQPDAAVRRIIGWSLALKLTAIAMRYVFAFVVYGGSADAARYHRRGAAIGADLRRFDLGDIAIGDAIGTEAMELLTGVVYAVTGPSIYLGFLVFGLLAWFGCYLFLRAFQTAVPDGDHRLYAVLVLLLPSMLYWSASIGKESWMMLVLGLASLGAARLLGGAGPSHGAVLLAAGVAGAVLLRPHMGVLVLVGLVGAVVLTRRSGGWASQLFTLAVLVLLGVFAASQAQQFFGVESLTVEAVTGVLEDTDERTAIGGSEFDNVSVTNPLRLPLAFVSVVFRPFPFEAPNLQALLLSFEGLILAVVFWRRRADLVRGVRGLRSRPYVGYALTYGVALVVAFSNFNNLGLLARERVMLYPLLFVLLAAVPKSPQRAGDFRAVPTSTASTSA